MINNPFISIISPVYNAEKIIDELVNRIELAVKSITDRYEIILIEDDSPDNSWLKIQSIAKNNSNVKGIKFSRNFGQHPAIYCGLKHAKGDCAIIIDCDLQEDPKYFNDLIEQYKNGYDIVYTFRAQRKHSFFKNITAFLHNKVYNYLIDNKYLAASNNVGSFSLISRKTINGFIAFNDYQFHYLIVLRWLAYKSTFIEIEHKDRYEGKSSYNFKKLLEHALVAIIFQSDKLLRLNIYAGFIISLISFLGAIVIIIQYFMHGFQSGWPSLFVLLLFSLGIILFSIGILGLYLGKMFDQVKNRPKYIVQSYVNYTDEGNN